MSYSIRCHCGKLKGILDCNRKVNRTVNRCICYCADCQAFARFLNREHEILDEMGGTRIIQTIPANLTLTEGIENLGCMRLTANGLLRWYTLCCNTPIGNTLATLNPSFVGLIQTCLDADQTSLDNALGPIRMYVNTESAIGENKPKAAGVFSGTLRVFGMMLKARLDGRYRQTPFFDSASGTPIAVPKVLSDEELKRVKIST